MTLRLQSVQIGQDANANNNFVIRQPAPADGTLRITRGNWNALGTDVLVVNADNTVSTKPVTVNPPWIIPTFLNGWTNYDSTFSPAGYYKDGMGVVHLHGLVRSGTLGTAIFNLPAGYRPAGQELFASISNQLIGRIDVQVGGNVMCTSGSNAWITLSGISFKAA